MTKPVASSRSDREAGFSLRSRSAPNLPHPNDSSGAPIESLSFSLSPLCFLTDALLEETRVAAMKSDATCADVGAPVAHESERTF